MANRFLLIVLFSLSGLSGLSAQQKSTIQIIREDLFYSDFDIEKSFEFYKYINDLNDPSPLIKAYEAAAEALIAKHSWNPVSKISYLNNAQKLLDEAIFKDGLNVEIRFLRLYIENSIPGYLGMSKNKGTDKKIIIENIDKLNSMNIGTDIKNYIIDYITSPKVSSKEEIAEIKSKIEVVTPPSF